MHKYLHRIFLFILLNLFYNSSFSQLNNLINNSSFELSHPDAEPDEPNGIAQVHRIQSGGDDFYLLEWRSRTREATDAPGQFLHSPDWYKNPGNFSYGGVQGFDGAGYVGMGNYELRNCNKINVAS